MSSVNQLTARCPECSTIGVRFVNEKGEAPSLRDFEKVERYQPVQMPQTIKVMCANKACKHEYK